MTQESYTATGIADRVKAALESANLDQFGDLLSPDVQWGAPDQRVATCQNRAQVMKWWSKGRDAGVRATVTEVEVHGEALLVALTVRRDGVDAARWQVLTVGPAGVTDIRGFEDRPTAVARLEHGLKC